MSRTAGAVPFHEEQRFPQKQIWLMLATPPLGFLALLVWQVALGRPWGRHPMSNGSLIGWDIFLWLIFLRLVTVKLVTDVEPEHLSVTLRGIWKTRRIPFADMKSAEATTYNALRDYGGWGIRSGKRGKAYTARGDQGVQIKLERGGNVLIGSQRPAELAQALTQRILEAKSSQA